VPLKIIAFPRPSTAAQNEANGHETLTPGAPLSIALRALQEVPS
jgi:hypothetical protein